VKFYLILSWNTKKDITNSTLLPLKQDLKALKPENQPIGLKHFPAKQLWKPLRN